MAYLDAALDSGLVALRESLEAFLLVGILSGIVVKLGQPKARKFVLGGAAAGAAVATALGIVASGIAKDLYEANAALFEGLASLFAAAILTYMIVWMYRHTRDLMGTLHTKAKAALGAGRPMVLFGLSFVAVVREGVELAAITTGQVATSPGGAIVGVLVGIGLSAVLAFLLFAGVVKLSVQGFFAVTGAILVVVAAGMLITTVHELSEPADEGGPGWFPETPQLIDLHATLPTECAEGEPATASCITGGILHVLVGYRDDLRVAELGVWVLFVGAFTAGYLARRQAKHPAP